MPTRRRVLATTAAMLFLSKVRPVAANGAPLNLADRFNWLQAEGIDRTGRREIEAAGLWAAQAARLTRASFFVGRFDGVTTSEETFPLVQEAIIGSLLDTDHELLAVTAPSFSNQSSAYLVDVGVDGSSSALLLIRDRRDIHVWQGTIDPEMATEWSEPPVDPTTYLTGLVGIADRIFTGDRTEPEWLADTLPTTSQLPLGFVIVSEDVNDDR
jgi:hypothetical protein